MLTVARLVAWTCALEVLWAMFVGTTQSTELIAGLIAAALVALFVEALRAVGVLGFRFSFGAVASAWSIPGHVLFDFVLVLGILVRDVARGRRVRGQWLTVPFTEEPGARGRFRRALAAALENESANGMVVDLDDGRALLHSLDTRVSTGRQVM
ncbi:MAG TPA: hypothetical protein VGC78_06515 [Gaiellaceae bacterium]